MRTVVPGVLWRVPRTKVWVSDAPTETIVGAGWSALGRASVRAVGTRSIPRPRLEWIELASTETAVAPSVTRTPAPPLWAIVLPEMMAPVDQVTNTPAPALPNGSPAAVGSDPPALIPIRLLRT